MNQAHRWHSVGCECRAMFVNTKKDIVQEFTLVLSGVNEVTPELADALYEVTHGDIEFDMRAGVASLRFQRAAPNLRGAILAAIKEVEGAGIRVVRVESETANTIAKINADLFRQRKSTGHP